MSTPSGSMDDTFVIGDGGITLDISNYTGAQPTYTIGSDTITLGNIDWNSMNSTYATSTGETLVWSDSYTNWGGAVDPKVNVNQNGIEIKGEGDLKIGDRSMKEFMDKVEDQLAILRPAPELEEKWDKLKELRRQYEECKQDIIEKEKIMEILKRD